MDTGELEYWRTYFKSAKSDIIEVIENAVMVAALDFPTELKLCRVQISEKLYSPHWSDFFCAELSVPKKDNVAGFGVENKNKKSISNRFYRNGSKSDDGGCKSRLDGNGRNDNNVDKSMIPVSCIPNRLDRNGSKSVDGGGKNTFVSNRGKLKGGGGVETKVQNDNNVDKSMSPISCIPNRLDRNGSGLIHGGCKSRSDDGDVSGKNCLVGNGGKLEGSGGCVETRFDRSRNNNVDMFMTPVNIFSDLEAEALFDEIDEENRIVSEVLKIKKILDNCVHQSDTTLFESLRKLQLVVVSVEILKETLIGRAVKPLCNHGSMQICRLALMLIKDWRKMVDEWMTATPMISETLNDSVNPPPVNDDQSGLDDDQPGLPLPPLDVGAFFAGPISNIDLSDQFFDGMDDDGNPQSSAELDKIQENGKKPSPNKHDKLKSHLPKEVNDVIIKEEGVAMKQEPVLKATKWPNNNKSGSVRHSTKQNLEEKLLDETQNSDAVVIPKRPPTGQHDNFKFSEEKLEATRRKLQQGYQQAKDAKKQRTTQFMDLHEIPKQVQIGHKNTQWRRQKRYGPRFTSGCF